MLAPFQSGARRSEAVEEQRLKDAMRDQVAPRAVTPRLVAVDGVQVGDPSEPSSDSAPSEFSIEDWNNAADLGSFK